MAIQNFLSGGFYGKLGEVVGQRWHNKRTIRTHVIPHNPQTEIQQANRKLFSTATRLAQIAYKVNRGDKNWDTSQMGQFSLMVGQAKRHLQNGESELDSIPWYPDGFTPPTSVFEPTIVWSDSSYSFTVTDPSFIFKQTRELEIVCNAWNCLMNDIEIFTVIVTVQQGSTFSWTFSHDNKHAFYDEYSTIQIRSINDSQFNESIIMEKTIVEQNQIPDIYITLNDFNIEDDTWGDAWLLNYLPTVMVDDLVIDIPARYYNYNSQQWVLGEWTIEIDYDDQPIFLLLQRDNDIDWREGSYFGPWSTIFRRAYCILYITAEQIPVSL